MKRSTGGLLVFLAVFGLIQFLRPARTNPPEGLQIQAPDEIAVLLETSCYDCHSSRTEWPWYSNVAPVSWWVVRHVEDAREDLDLTDWPAMDPEEQRFFLSEMKKQVKQQKMPLPSYLWIHRDARLTWEERSQLVLWIDDELAALASFAGPDF